MARALIELEGFSFRYSGSEDYALRDVSLSIDRGEFVVVAGPSGSGKTTLARAIVGLIPHFYSGDYSGVVWVDGIEVAKSSIREVTSRVGYVFQNPESQLLMSTVERDIAFRLEYSGLDPAEVRRRVEEVMGALGISHLAHRHVERLSGGEVQKVAIAGVLAARPKAIILDEPTAYLSPRSVVELMGLLRRLNREMGIAVMLIDHRLDLVVGGADRLVVIHGGRVVLDEHPEEALRKPLDRLYGLNVPSSSRIYRVLLEAGFSPPSPMLSPEEYAELIAGGSP